MIASKHTFWGLMLTLVTLSNLACPNMAMGDSILSMFRKKSPGSDTPVKLEAEHGPWLILAATLSGDDAEAKAYALAGEIRSQLRLPSFVMKRSAQTPGTLGVGERIRTRDDGQLVSHTLKVKYANSAGNEAYAVLVGEFTSTEDPRIQDALHSIRVAQPKALGASGKPEQAPGKTDDANWLVKNTRKMFWWQSSRDDNLKKGPMGAAFVTRNPMLPEDFFQAPAVDDFVKGLNKQVKHSLLDCPGRFTVRVASFYGHAVTDIGGGTSPKNLDGTTDALDKAASQANQMTLALRAKGFEAFQFHDRFGSYVMIGSFDDLGSEVAGGDFQYNPAMVAVINEHCGYRVIDVKDPQTGAISRRQSLKSIDKIPFDVDGKPMAVPRVETSSLYSGSRLGQR